MNYPNRRSLLGTMGAIAGTVAASGLAGCSSLVDSGSPYPEYAEWVHHAGANVDAPKYGVHFTDAESIGTQKSELEAEVYEVLRRRTLRPAIGWWGFLNGTVPFEDVSAFVSFPFPPRNIMLRSRYAGSVIVGQYDAKEVEESLENGDEHEFEKRDGVDGYTLLVTPDDRDAVGIGDSAIVVGRAGEDHTARTIVERTIDARRGVGARYVDESEEFATLVDELGPGDFVKTTINGWAEPEDYGVFSGEIASGTRHHVDGSTTEFRNVRLFEEEGDIDMDAIDEVVREWAEEQDLSPDPETSKNGRSIAIEYRTGTEEWLCEGACDDDG